MSRTPLNVALVGFGNIGTGVVRLWREHAGLLADRAGRPLVLHTICDKDLDRDRGVPTDGVALTSDWRAAVTNPAIHAVIELVGGTGIAREVVETALSHGKHVVTANKALVATAGGDLWDLADRHGVHVLFEASVGAGIPIIRSMQRGLAANRFTRLHGILNGTCNFILSKMEEQPGTAFETVLAEAQRLGYAEPDPALDINGNDTAHKIAILASLAFGMDLRADDVELEGITRITPDDLALAHERGFTVKLVATASRPRSDGPVSLSVWPTLVPANHLLGRVRGVLNALWVEAEPIGPTMYYGAGAGQGSTASAILSDVMLLAAADDNETLRRLNPLRVPAGVRDLAGPGSRHEGHFLRINHVRPDKVHESLPWPVVGSGHGWITFDVPPLEGSEREEMLGRLEPLGVGKGDLFEMRHAVLG